MYQSPKAGHRLQCPAADAFASRSTPNAFTRRAQRGIGRSAGRVGPEMAPARQAISMARTEWGRISAHGYHAGAMNDPLSTAENCVYAFYAPQASKALLSLRVIPADSLLTMVLPCLSRSTGTVMMPL